MGVMLEANNIRVPAALAETMFRIAATECGDETLKERLAETGFRLAGIRLAQEISTALAFAESIVDGGPFEEMIQSMTFTGGDADLHTVGLALMDRILREPRLGQTELDVPQALYLERHGMIRRLL